MSADEVNQLTVAIGFVLAAIVQNLEKSGHINVVEIGKNLLVLSEALVEEGGKSEELAKTIAVLTGVVVAGIGDPTEIAKKLH